MKLYDNHNYGKEIRLCVITTFQYAHEKRIYYEVPKPKIIFHTLMVFQAEIVNQIVTSKEQTAKFAHVTETIEKKKWFIGN